MPFIELGKEFGDSGETPMAKEGEYDLVCTECNHEQEGGKNNLVLQLKFESEDYSPFRHYISLPSPENDTKKDEEKGQAVGTTSEFKLLMAKRFCNLFGVPFTDTGFDTNDIVGARARAGVTIGPVNDKGNRYQNLIVPRLPDED